MKRFMRFFDFFFLNWYCYFEENPIRTLTEVKENENVFNVDDGH